MPLPIRVLRRKRRQPPLTGTAADAITWFVDDLSSGGGFTSFRLLFLASGMSQTADAFGTDFEVYYDAGSGFGLRTIASATGGPTADGFEVILTCNDEINTTAYQVLLKANQTSLSGPFGQRYFVGQIFPSGNFGTVCAQV